MIKWLCKHFFDTPSSSKENIEDPGVTSEETGCKMKYLLVTTGSILLTASVLVNAYYQKKQFYPSVVYITRSSPSMAVGISLLTTSIQDS